jgi:hypothetical protein
MSRAVLCVSFVVLLYVGTYMGFRQSHAEVWERDQRVYVMFPEGSGTLLYYLWRPLTYIDAAMTGMRFHIGPHR